MKTIAYAANNPGWEEVLLSLLSIIKQSGEPLDVHLFSCQFLDVHFSYRRFSRHNAAYIDKTIKSVSPESSFALHDVEKLYAERFLTQKREWGHRSPYTLLKYLLPEVLKDKDRAIWLDYDVLALKDPTPVFDFDLGDKPLAAKPLFGKTRRKRMLFDTGLIVMDLKKIRDEKTFQPVFDYIKGRAIFMDLTSYSRLLADKTALLPEYALSEKFPSEASVFKHFRKRTRYSLFQIKPVRSLDEKTVNEYLKIESLKPVYELYRQAVKDRQQAEASQEEDNNRRYIIQIKHLYKTYGSLKAVNDVSFNVERGSLFAFLGLNGAGKSTTINIISSILEKDYGSVTIDGYDLDKERNAIKKEIGIVFQSSTLDDNLTAYENLAVRASFYGLSKKEKEERIKEISRMLDLDPLLERYVGKLSGGQRRRLDIARSMVHSPRLLILDEPTTGLDPKTRQDVWRLINDIREKTGMTVFLTTHYLEEAEKASDVVIMDHGRIIASGTPVELKNKYSRDYVIAYGEPTGELESLAKKKKAIYDNDRGAYLFPVKDSKEAALFLENNKDVILDFEVKKGDMDDVFLRVTGLKFEENKDEGK